MVVGIDIGSTTQYVRAFDWRDIELGKIFLFSSSQSKNDGKGPEVIAKLVTEGWYSALYIPDGVYAASQESLYFGSKRGTRN